MSITDKRRAIEPADIKKLAMLLGAAPVAWLLPPWCWPTFSRPASRSGLFGAGTGRLPPRLVEAMGGDLRQARARLTQSYVEDCLTTLRAWMPWGAGLRIEMSGLDHLRSALGEGHGAIVWTAQTSSAPLVAKMGLWRAGFAMTHLSRPSHRFSATRFGVRFLNPVQTRIEDRYIGERITMRPGTETAALLRLRRRLAANGVVSITAGGPADERVSVPFLGADLSLPVGALRLAILTGAPILPYFIIRTGPVSFRAELATPLTIASGSRPDAYRIAASQWANLFEDRLRQRLELWQSWIASVE